MFSRVSNKFKHRIKLFLMHLYWNDCPGFIKRGILNNDDPTDAQLWKWIGLLWFQSTEGKRWSMFHMRKSNVGDFLAPFTAIKSTERHFLFLAGYICMWRSLHSPLCSPSLSRRSIKVGYIWELGLIFARLVGLACMLYCAGTWFPFYISQTVHSLTDRFFSCTQIRTDLSRPSTYTKLNREEKVWDMYIFI